MTQKFVAVMGLHSSGSSCVAGVLFHLGLNLGSRLAGFYGSDPSKTCGFESSALMRICRQAVVVPKTELQNPKELMESLHLWISRLQVEALAENTIAAGKYPTLCRMGPILSSICEDGLIVINVERDIEESIQSLNRRFPRISAQDIEHHQRWLWDGKCEFLDTFDPSRQLDIEFDELLTDSRNVIESLASFLNLDVDQNLIDNSMRWVDPSKRHVNLRKRG